VDPSTVLWGFVTDPRVGVPVLLLGAATLLWFAMDTPAEPRRAGWEPATPEPDRDPVSRTFVALRHESYSTVLLESYARLDAALKARTGRRLGEIPWSTKGARKLGIPQPRELEKTRIGLDSLYVWAVRLETDSILRRDFWRTWETSRVVFLRRLAARLHAVDGHLTNLGYAP